MSNSVDKLLSIAQAEIDYRGKKTEDNLDDKYANAGRNGIQSGRGYTKYGRDLDNITRSNRQNDVSAFYNGYKNGYDWCAMFVDWCFVQAFGEDEMRKLTHHVSSGAGCNGAAQSYYKNNQFIAASAITKDNPPQPGDEIFYGSLDSSGKPVSCSHTGIVEKVSGSTIFTIEGNINHAQHPGGRVNRRSDIKILSNGGVSGGVCGFGRAIFDKYPNPLDFPPMFSNGIIQSEDKKQLFISGTIGGVPEITTGLTLYYQYDTTDLVDISNAYSVYIDNSDSNIFSFTINKYQENAFAKSIAVKVKQHNQRIEDSGTIYGGVDYLSNNYIQNLKANYGCISVFDETLKKYSPYVANDKLSFDNYIPLVYDKNSNMWYEIYDTYYSEHE